MKLLSKRSALSSLLGAALVVGATAGGGIAAYADEPTQDPAFQEILTSVDEFHEAHGVSQATRDALAAKLESGVLLDSQNGSAPVSTTTSTVGIFDVTVSQYADGSLSESRVERPQAEVGPGQIGTRGVSECQANGGLRSNCKIDRWDGIIQQSFRATFTFLSGYDRIDSVYSPSYIVVGSESASQAYFGIVQQYENASGPARAEHRVTAQLPVLGSVSYTLGLRVGANIGGQSYT
jgi:hypothetical protein